MAATIGHVTADILAKAGRGRTRKIGTIDIPIEAVPAPHLDNQPIDAPTTRRTATNLLRLATEAIDRNEE